MVRTQPRLAGGVFDIGALAEAALFYQDTEVVLSVGELDVLLQRYSPEEVLRLVRDGYVNCHLFEKDVAVRTDTVEGHELHRPVTYRIGTQTAESAVVELFRKATGKSGRGRRLAQQFLESAPVLGVDSDWYENVGVAITDPSFITKALPEITREAAPGFTKSPTLLDVRRSSEGVIELDMDSAWSELCAYVASQPGSTGMTQGNLLACLITSLTDLMLAAHFSAEIATNELGASILTAKCIELDRAAVGRGDLIAAFQEHILDGRDVRGVVNSGERNLHDVMDLLDQATSFRGWLQNAEFDASLVSAYVRECTKKGWASTLRARTIRYAVSAAPTIALTGTAGIATSLAFGAVDGFLVDRIAEGWRPNHFVERRLQPFVNP